MRQRQERASYASERARVLFGQYRKGDANDPDTYVAGVAAVLAEYPPDTIRYVTDPRTGIASNPLPDPDTGRLWTGMPDLANVRRACEIHYAPIRQAAARQKQIDEQLAERKQIESENRPLPAFERPAGHLANLFCAASLPFYAKLKEQADKETDKRLFRYGVGPDGRTQGIWVVQTWYQAGTPPSMKKGTLAMHEASHREAMTQEAAE